MVNEKRFTVRINELLDSHKSSEQIDTWSADISELTEYETLKVKLFKELFGSNGPLVDSLNRYLNLMDGAKSIAPYKPGDRAVLRVAPTIGSGSGWRGAAHFLVAGALATVKCCQLHSNGWGVGLVFDNDSRVDHLNGDITMTPINERGIYFFRDFQLSKVSDIKLGG